MNSFELNDEEYQFLLDDIEEAIAEGNRKYGYGGYGFVDRFGNHYRDPQPRTVPESDLGLKRLGIETTETSSYPSIKSRLKSKIKLRKNRPQIHYRPKPRINTEIKSRSREGAFSW